MMIQFDETSGTASGANEPLSRSHMRDGASRNSNPVPGISVGQRGDRLSESSPAVRHRAANSGIFMSVQGERPSHLSSSRNAEFRDRVAFRVFGFMIATLFLLPLILAGTVVAFR